jgi:pimeloyl-ACP methyl ester carboxylesterase
MSTYSVNASLALAFLLSLLASAGVASADNSIRSQTAEVDGLNVHYLSAGEGPPLILLHGYAQTSRMWKPLMAQLSNKFSIIAPDLPAIGDSEIPAEGTDVKGAAVRIHALAHALGMGRASVVGHDIGLMVAYAYAAQFPADVEKLALVDAFLPGVPGWEIAYNDPGLWHFRFNGPTPAALVRGRERIYLDYYWNEFAADPARSIPEADRESYAAAYARPGRMEASWAYFASWPELARDFARLSQTRLEMPVLSLGGERSMGALLASQTKLVAANVTVVILPGAGHWVMEERPRETSEALARFLLAAP